MYLFKRIKIVIFCFLPFIVKGQIPVQRSTSGVTVMDSRLKANLNLVGPAYHDTTAANVQKGLDSLGAIIYDSTHNIYWFRGWNGDGGKKWITFGGSSLINPMTTKGDIIFENAALAPDRLAGNTTTIRRWLNSTGTGAAPNLPFYDTLASSDITNALGYTPYPSTNPNGYISSLTLPPLYLKNGLHARDSVTAVLGGNLDTSNTKIKIGVGHKLLFDSAQSSSTQGIAINFGSDATGDIFYRDANGNITRLGIGSSKQHLVGGTIPSWKDTATSGITKFATVQDSIGAEDRYFGMHGHNFTFNDAYTGGAPGLFTIQAYDADGSSGQTTTSFILETGITMQVSSVLFASSTSVGINYANIQFNSSAGDYRFLTLNTSSDSTTFKPLGVNSSGQIRKMTNWIGGSGGGSTLTRQNITSGSSHTVTGGNYLVQYNYSSVQATETLTLPASPADQDIVDIQTGTTIAAPNAEITSFTISPNSGQTINPYSSVTAITLFSGAHIKLRYNSSGTFWDRLD